MDWIYAVNATQCCNVRKAGRYGRHRGVCHRLLAGLFVFSLLAACGGKQDDRQAIRKLIDDGAALAEQHRIGALMRLTSSDFKALPGDYTERTLRGVLFAIFQRYGRFDIRYPRPVVTLAEAPGGAQAVVYLMVVSRDQPLPDFKELMDDPRRWLEQAGEKADLYQLRLGLVQKDGDWRVRQARIEGFKGWAF